MSVSGKVKIEVIIAPDGHVKSTRAIGGHPLLVQTCTDAVKEWKFFPAPEESTQVVEFDFTGSEQQLGTNSALRRESRRGCKCP